MKEIKYILVGFVYLAMSVVVGILLQAIGLQQIRGVFLWTIYSALLGSYLSWKIIELIRSTARDE